MTKPTISLVVPFFNEEDNVKDLYLETKNVFINLLKSKRISDYSMVFVNDGSNDKTQEKLIEIKRLDPKVKVIELRKNFGQTPALKAGFDNVDGDLIVTMDGDLQNDPKDIPLLMDKMEEGYDVVSGWRFNRKDKFSKRIFSKIMNKLRISLIGDELHDYGCSLKLYKRECLKDLELFGELHRYITAYLYVKGYKIGEVKVNHRPRKSGKTKYKFNRGINGILDLFYLKFWSSYSNKPLHFFGRLGLFVWFLSFLMILEQIIKAIIVRQLTLGPVLMLSAVFGITGLLLIIFGFLSEIMIRIYFKDKELIYNIKSM